MDFSNVTLGNKAVAEVWMGNIKIYPSTPSDAFMVTAIYLDDVLTENTSYLDADSNSHWFEIVVLSLVGGQSSNVTLRYQYDYIGLSGGGYTEPNPGERHYSFTMPGNSTREERDARIQFTQQGTGQVITINIYQEEYM